MTVYGLAVLKTVPELGILLAMLSYMLLLRIWRRRNFWMSVDCENEIRNRSLHSGKVRTDNESSARKMM